MKTHTLGTIINIVKSIIRLPRARKRGGPFISPEKGRGADSAIKIKKLGVNAIPLRFVGLLLDNPIIVVENGVKILVPNPANFCLHKLIIASRRRKIDKSDKSSVTLCGGKYLARK